MALPQCTPLTKDARPTHLTLATLHRELNTHAMAQKTSLGGGNHGYLTLLISDIEYARLTPAAFIDPVYPGPNPIHPPGSTAAQITETNRAYAADMVSYNTFHAIENTLKNMLINAVPHTFIQILEDHRFGFSQVRTKAILQHLDATYGQVTIEDLANNLEAMNRPWDPATPIEELWTQIHKARNYAANDNVISDTTAVLSAVQNLTTTGLFTTAFEHWRNKAIADQTYANLMIHFNQANLNRLHAKTTGEAGYSVTTAPPTGNKENENGGSIKGYHYCWSHGVNRTHQSHTCQNPKEGHIKSATIANMQGGSVYIHQPKRFTNNNRNRNPGRNTTTQPRTVETAAITMAPNTNE